MEIKILGMGCKKCNDLEANTREAVKMAGVEAEIEKVEALINDEDLKSLKEKTDSVEFEIKRLNTNLNNANNDLAEFGREIAFSQSLIDTKTEEISNIEKNNKTLEKDKVTYAKEIEELKLQLEKLEEQIAEITEKLGELLKQRDEIKEELSLLENLKKQKSNYILNHVS